MRIPSKIFQAFLISMCFLSLVACEVEEQGNSPEYLIEVKFPQANNVNVPVIIKLPPECDDTTSVWELVALDDPQQRKTYGQQFCREQAGEPSGSSTKEIAFLWNPGSSDSLTKISFILKKPSSPPETGFNFEEHDPIRLALTEDKKPVFSYTFGAYSKPGVHGGRPRSSYFHPVYGLDGEVLTSDYPEDHPHHRGIFWSWPQVFVDRDTVNLWALSGIKNRFERWKVKSTGPVFAELAMQNGWYIDERKVVDETVRVKVFKAGLLGRAMDFSFTWAAVDDPVTLLGSKNVKGYGGFGFRMAPFQDNLITTVKGGQTERTDRVPSPWADFSARFSGSDKVSGVVVFDNKRNPGFPNGWTLRPVFPYGYIGVAWPGIEPFTIEPCRPVQVNYRVWIHRKDAEQGKVIAAYQAYCDPPLVKVVR